MKNTIVQLGITWLFLILGACVSQKSKQGDTSADSTFNMVFMTDIHLQNELNAVDGFRKAMDTINKLKPQFVITGGDLISDALAQTQSRADSLFELYTGEIKRLHMPVYNTPGNHELFGVYPESGTDTTHQLYANKMYKSKIGKTYYSFNHKHWQFIVLDAAYPTSGRRYIGYITPEQIKWLKRELFSINPKTPIALVVHIPMLTGISQFNKGALACNSESLVITNSREILEAFSGFNLKLVLQGHLHVLEDNFVKNIHFITGGAVCGGWWKGPYDGTGEGFLYMTFKGDQFSWKYIDYGWNPTPKK